MRMCKQRGYTHIKVISSRWYTPAVYQYFDKGEVSCIGIITVEDTITGEIKQYIGLGTGKDPIFDEDLIIAAGSRFYGV